MPIQDSEAERRNLIVTSLCFIAYNLGGGNFTSNEVRLQVINVSFTDPIFLGFLAWMGLFWFAYRFGHDRRASGIHDPAAKVNPFNKTVWTRKWPESSKLIIKSKIAK